MAAPLDTWTPRSSSAISSRLAGVAYGNGTIAVVGDAGTVLTSPDAKTWTSRSIPRTSDLGGVAFVNGRFIAVGGENSSVAKIYTSSDAATWTTTKLATPGSPLSSVAFGNDVYVASGELALFRSTDGQNWREIFGEYGFAVAFSGSRFATVDILGSISTSVDGSSWLSRFTPTSSNLKGIAYGTNLFVAVGDNGVILTSPTGTTWTGRQSGTSRPLYAVTYGLDTFVAVGFAGTIVTSLDGITWTKRVSGTTKALNGVAAIENSFVIVGDGGTILQSDNLRTPPIIVRGPSAVTAMPGQSVSFGAEVNGTEPLSYQWRFNGNNIPGATNSTLLLRNVSAANAGSYSVIVQNSAGNSPSAPVPLSVQSSVAGAKMAAWKDWQLVASPISTDLNAVAFGSGRFAAVGENGIVLTSSDGRTWSKATSPATNSLDGVSFANNLFVAVGAAGTVMTAADGTQWTMRYTKPESELWLHSVAYGNGTFVTLGDDIFSDPFIVLRSSDGINWNQSAKVQRTLIYNSVTFGSGQFVAVGSDLSIATSADATSWRITDKDEPFSWPSFKSVVFGQGHFVAVGGMFSGLFDTNGFGTRVGYVSTSSDSAQWFLRRLDGSDELSSVAYVDNAFIAVDDSGQLLTSGDGVTWIIQAPPVDRPRLKLKSIAYGNGVFVAVGDAGKIVTSASGAIDPKLELQAPAFRIGSFEFGMKGTLGSTIVIQTSTDLRSWTDVNEMAISSDTAKWSQSGASRFSQRFFRARYK